MTTFDRLLSVRERRGAGFLILIDPDKIQNETLPSFIREATEAGVDGFLVGGSLVMTSEFEKQIAVIKHNTTLPVVIFPGSPFQVSSAADAILFLVLISGRNPEHLIGNQVLAAPVIKKMGLEAISTGSLVWSASWSRIVAAAGPRPAANPIRCSPASANSPGANGI